MSDLIKIWQETEKDLLIIKNEIASLGYDLKGNDLSFVSHLNSNEFNLAIANKVRNFIDTAKRYYSKVLDDSIEKKDAILHKLKVELGGEDALVNFKNQYHNANLEDLLLCRMETDKIEEYQNHLIRKDEPVYKQAEMKFGRAHFFAADKRIMNLYIDTYWFNLFVLLIMSLFFYFLLITDALFICFGLIDSIGYATDIKNYIDNLKKILKPVLKNSRSNDKQVKAFY